MSSSINNPSSGGGGGGGGGAGMATATSHVVNATVSTPSYNDNTGAVGTITLTMAATPALEAAIKRTASFELRVAPAAGKTITWSGGTLAVGKYLRLLSDDAVIHVVVDALGNVQVISEFGALVEQV